FQEEHLVQPDPLVAKKIGRVSADEDLAPRLALEARKHLGHEPDDVGMKRLLRFLKQQRASLLVKRRPQKTNQAERAVRELFLRLPGAQRAPVLISPPKVRKT